VRTQTLILLLSTLLLAIAARSVNAEDRINFAYISPNAGSSSVLWIAKDAGIFKKHGLDVNVIYIEGTPKALMLFAGELQVVAGTGPAVASAQVRGADASMIMGFEVYLPYYLIATPAIKSIEDLKGKVGTNHSAATSADFACAWASGISVLIRSVMSVFAWSARPICACS
jgi:NitT/TauT family transport system substrate-binding protein